MNRQHHIEELERRIEEIENEPIKNWMGKVTKAMKIRKIRAKIKSLQKES